MPKIKKRCKWAAKSNSEYTKYHDQEWGVPVWDDRTQFEFLILEGAQAGLSWSTILNKREGYRRNFSNFDPSVVACFSVDRIEKILQDPSVVRNTLKINAAVTNAQAFLKIQAEFDSFCNYIWQFVDYKPKQNKIKTSSDILATSPESDLLSKDLQNRGFKFVGSTIIYAHMQATGMVNDHEVSCFRYQECAALADGKGV